MTVAELIALLSTMPQDAAVTVWDNEVREYVEVDENSEIRAMRDLYIDGHPNAAETEQRFGEHVRIGRPYD
jgi:hypothetical protein